MRDPRLQIEHCTARLRAAPESPWFMPLASAHRELGDLEAAQRVLQVALDRHPRHVSARVLLAQVQLDLQQEEAAEASFARVLELDPENVVALRYRAERARRRGALERAYEILRLLLEVDPFDRDVQADLGLLSAALERRTRAAAPEPPLPATPPAPPPRVEVPPPVESSPPTEPSRLNVPWLHAGSAGGESDPPSALEPPPIDLDRVGRGAAAPSQPALDRGPFAPRPPEPRDVVPQTEAAPGSFERPADRDWTFTRSEDRIVVTPSATPPRGPIRSVEQRVWGVPAEPPPAPPAMPPVQSLPRQPTDSRELPAADAGDAFSTLTLARIYESQGYLEKALAIYDDLRRRYPEDREVATHLAALQRRLAGIGEPPPPQASPTPTPTPVDRDAAVTWRLVEPQAVEPTAITERLRQATSDVRDRERERRHTVIGVPPVVPAAPPVDAAAPRTEDVSRGHADFERFLQYVRSLKP